MTGIEWTDETWNPTSGCDRVSAGCDHCYALAMSARLKGMGQAPTRAVSTRTRVKRDVSKPTRKPGSRTERPLREQACGPAIS